MPIEFHSRVLPTGLTVLAETDPAAHTAAVGFFVRTGARDEAPPLMGVSHFLEHMMFKGTDALTADDINRTFDEMGARYNAYTSHEITCFYAHVLPERLDEAARLVAAMLRPALRDDDFETERGVILEEIAMYRDDPHAVLFDTALQRHYNTHALGHRVLGTEQTVGSMAPADMRAYFRSRYSADNTVVALAGRLDFDHAADLIASACHDWKPTAPPRDSARPPVGGGEYTLRMSQFSRAYLCGLAAAPAIADDRRWAALLLARVLGASDNSRLHWALIEPGLADEAAAGYEAHDGCGEFSVYASCDPARADEVWSIVRAQIDALADSITDDDLDRLKNKTLTSVTVGSERPADRMQRLGARWTYLRAYTPLEDDLARINALTVDDLRAVARDFPLTPATTLRILPD